MQGIRELTEQAGEAPSALDQVFHGTTIATNIVIEHNGATVGLITTEGYRDILHIARHKKPLNFSNYQDLPWQRYPIVRRRYRLTVPERMLKDGSVLVPLDEDKARERVRQLKEAGVEAISVCFLFSFLNPEHEQRVAEIVREEFPEAFLSVSSEVLPQYREYERFSTVCLNAYVGPEGLALRPPARGAARGAGRQDEAAPDDLGERRRDARGRGRAAGQPAHVRPGRGRRRRHLGRQAGRLRQRDHARRRRHVGGHRPRAGGPPAHEAPARHQGRAVPGDDPDGRRRHDRRRRRLDRLRRPRRHLPRRPALGRRRPRPGGVRPRRHRADGHRRDGQPRLARARGVPRRPDGAPRRPRARRVRGRPGQAARTCPSRRRRWAPCRSSRTRWCSRSRRTPSARATTRATSRSSPRAAPGRCSRRRSRSRWARRGCSSRRTPASRRRWACSRRTWSTSTSRPPTSGSRSSTPAALEQQFEELEQRARAQLEEDGVPPDSMLVQRVADCRYLGQGYELRVDVDSGAIDDGVGRAAPRELPRHPRARVLAAVRGRPTSRSRTSASAASG